MNTEAITTEHRLKMADLGDLDIRAECSCGWTGTKHNRMSDDYAWTNSRDQWDRHMKEIRRGQ